MPRTAVCLILSVLLGVGACASTSLMLKPPIKIHKTDMSEELQQDALQFAFLALNLYDDDWNIGRYIVKEFEKKQWGTWICIVGDYAGYVQYNRNTYIHFSFGDTIFTVFRSA